MADKRRRERFCAAGRPHAWHRPVRNQPGAFGLNRRALSPRLRRGTPTTSGRCARSRGGDRMQDPSDSTERAEPEENGRSDTADSPVVEDPTSDSDIDSTTASTVLVEVLPGVALVAGEVPPELKPDLIDFGIVPAADRKQISAILASIGNAATAAGNLGNAFAGVQGLYRISDATQALLRSGATLAVKDGANLGAVMVPGRILGQARLYPVNAVSKAQTAASIGRRWPWSPFR
ncbi:hypothetical protein ACR6C2_24740 [Streptomyces sp. INA 01156]